MSIYKSQTFPTTGYRRRLQPEAGACRTRSSDAFFSFDWEGTTLQDEFEKIGEGQFLPMTYKEFWDVIRKIDAANGVSYACE